MAPIRISSSSFRRWSSAEWQRSLRKSRQPVPSSRPSSRAPWCRRYWSGNCVPEKCHWTNWSAPSARPRSRLRRRRSRLRRRPPPRRRHHIDVHAARQKDPLAQRLHLRVQLAGAHRLERAEVEPGAEVRALAGEDDSTDRWLVLELFAGRDQAAFGESVEVAPDCLARHVERAHEFGDRQRAVLRQLRQDVLMTLFGEHRVRPGMPAMND